MTNIMSSVGFLAKLKFSSEFFGKWGIRVECTGKAILVGCPFIHNSENAYRTNGSIMQLLNECTNNIPKAEVIEIRLGRFYPAITCNNLYTC